VRDDSGVTLLAYNHNVIGAEICEAEVAIHLKGLVASGPASIARIDTQHANPKQAWLDLGSPEYPTAVQLAEIERASQLKHEPLGVQADAEGWVIRFMIPAHGVVAIRLSL